MADGRGLAAPRWRRNAGSWRGLADRRARARARGRAGPSPGGSRTRSTTGCSRTTRDRASTRGARRPSPGPIAASPGSPPSRRPCSAGCPASSSPAVTNSASSAKYGSHLLRPSRRPRRRRARDPDRCRAPVRAGRRSRARATPTGPEARRSARSRARAAAWSWRRRRAPRRGRRRPARSWRRPGRGRPAGAPRPAATTSSRVRARSIALADRERRIATDVHQVGVRDDAGDGSVRSRHGEVVHALGEHREQRLADQRVLGQRLHAGTSRSPRPASPGSGATPARANGDRGR